jgi:hypothetical protein
MIKTNDELPGRKLLLGAVVACGFIAAPIVWGETGSGTHLAEWFQQKVEDGRRVQMERRAQALLADPALTPDYLAPGIDPSPYTFKGSTKGCKDWRYVGKPDNCEVFEYPTVVFVSARGDNHRDTHKDMRCVYRKKETGCRWVDADMLVPFSETYYGQPH